MHGALIARRSAVLYRVVLSVILIKVLEDTTVCCGLAIILSADRAPKSLGHIRRDTAKEDNVRACAIVAMLRGSRIGVN